MKRKLLLMGVVLSLLMPLGVVGQLWVGGFDNNNWCDSRNWSGNTVPGPEATIALGPDDIVNIPVGCDVVAKILSIEDGQLIISGTLTVSDLLESLSSTYIKIKEGGSLIYSPKNSFQPYLTVERALTGPQKYHLISSPVENPTIGSIFSEDLYDNIWLRYYNEVTGMWVELNTTSNLAPGIGYNYISDVASVTASFAGELNIGSKTINLSYQYGNSTYKGYNLLGNPFSSAIDWDLLTKSGNVFNTVYVWKQEAGNYINWNGSSGDVTNGIIPSCQGFFVKANALNQSITIPQSSQLHSSIGFYKNTQSNMVTCRITSDKNGYSDAAFIAFNEQATTGSDLQFDGEKMYGLEEAPQLYTKTLDNKYSINYLPSIEQVPQVPLCLESGIDATFTLKAEGMESFNGTIITLTDKKTGYSQKLNSNAEYTFDFTSGEAADRFMLSFEPVGLKEKQELNMGIYTIGNIVKIKFDEANSGTVNIAGLTGQTVYSEKFSHANNLDLNTQLAEGVYIVTVTTDDKISSRKVFIK